MTYRVGFLLAACLRQRLEAVETWTWRWVEKITWVDKITNEEVLQRVDETKTMLDTVGKRKHVVRACATC